MSVRRLLALLALAAALFAGSSASADPIIDPTTVDVWGDSYCVRAGLDPTIHLPELCIPLP